MRNDSILLFYIKIHKNSKFFPVGNVITIFFRQEVFDSLSINIPGPFTLSKVITTEAGDPLVDNPINNEDNIYDNDFEEDESQLIQTLELSLTTDAYVERFSEL